MSEIDNKLRSAHRRLAIKPGDIYESCSYQPILCLGIDYKNDNIWGVSLIDGSHPWSCSLLHCGIRKLSPKQAWLIKMTGPLEADAAEHIDIEKRWWREGNQMPTSKVGLIGPRLKQSIISKSKKTKTAE